MSRTEKQRFSQKIVATLCKYNLELRYKKEEENMRSGV